MIIAVTEARVQAVMKSNNNTASKIKSGPWRCGMLSKHIREVNPNFLNAAATAPKNPHRSEASRRSLTKSIIVKAWSKEELPRFYRMGTCLVCGKITFDTKRPPKFHRACWRAWVRTPEGMNYQRAKGPKPPLKQDKPGRPTSEENLKLHCFRAIQYYFAGKTFEEIAAGDLTDYAVEKSVKSLIARLPQPDLVAKRFQKLVKLLLEASGTVSTAAPSIAAMND